MPSIYNHENNACWGIRRSSCDMFQYDLNDEINSNKLGDSNCRSSENNWAPNSTYVQYSVSANGYYGYHPHKSAQTTMSSNDIAMDIEDIDLSPSISAQNDSKSMIGCAGMATELQPTNASRKRQMHCSSMDGSKRIRQEYGGGRSSLRRSRPCASVVDLNNDIESTTTQLLWKTHGCELHFYERTCDY